MADTGWVRETVTAGFDAIICQFDIAGFKWRLADEQSVGDHPDAPDINLVRMALLVVKDFWGNVVWSPTFSFLPLAFIGHFGCQSKIADLDLQLFGEEQVAQFEITVDDLLALDVLNGESKLAKVVFGFDISESFAPLEEFVKSLYRHCCTWFGHF